MLLSSISCGYVDWRRLHIAATVAMALVLVVGTARCGVVAAEDDESRHSYVPRIALKAGGVACAGIEVIDSRSGGLLIPHWFKPYRKFVISSGPSLGATIDFPFASWAMAGVSFDVACLNFDDEDHWSFAWAAHLMVGPPKDLGKIVCRVGAGCGVLVVQEVIIATEDDYSLGSSDHLAIKLFAQMGREPKRGVGFLFEPQVVFTLPSDLAYADQVRLKPLCLLRVGAVM